MAQALAPHPAAAPTPSPARKHHHSSPPAVVGLGSKPAPHPGLQQHATSIGILHQRRTFIYGLVGAGLGCAIHGGEANAAARRPPPPPPTEKKDPNVSGVQAKVLASKKRREAMKEAMAQLRERGKPISEPPKKPITEPTSEPIIETPQ